MAIVTAAIWQSWANRTLFGSALTQLNAICPMVDQAVKTYLKRTLESQAFTNIIISAPRTQKFQLFRYTPILVSSFQLWLNRAAMGDPTKFDPVTSLQVPYSDYLLETSRDDSTVSTNGIVNYLRGGPWAVGYLQPPYSVAAARVDVPGAIKLSFTGGYLPAAIPQDIILACCQAVSKIRNNPRFGVQPQSESWNGYSMSLPSQAYVNGIIASPEISGFLDPYLNRADCIG